MNKKLLALALSALQVGQPLLAYAQTSSTASSSYSVQVPVTTVPFTPSKTTYDFGNVLVGQRPQHVFTFVNRGTAPLTVTAVSGFMNASVVTDNCSGKVLQGGETCSVMGALLINQATATTGEIRVAHTANATPDIFALKATGVSAAGTISATQPAIDFGDAALNQAVGPRAVSFKNTGSTAVDILDLSLTEGGSNYVLDITGCITKLAPGASCSMQATFKPQAIGLLQGRITGTLGDGSEVSLVNLAGNGVQGTPTWSSSQVSFLDGVPGVKSSAQSVTLTNTGKGTLSITSAAITGDATFKLENSSCGATLAPGGSCTFQVSNTPPDTSIHSGYLELQTANSSLKTARIQVYSRPMLQRAILAVDPVTVDFGDLGVGVAKTMNVTLRSTGNIAANVNRYALGGANVAAFSILNATQCTGALAPNNQCVLQIQARPTAVGAQTGTATITADTPDPVPVLQLKVNGLGAAVSADKVNLSFGSVTQGDTPTLSAIISNTGGAPARLNSISTPQGTLIFTNARDTTGACAVGGTLAVGATCKLNVSFLTTGQTGYQTGSFVMNFDSGAVAVSTTGTVVVPPAPTASLSTFTCPTSVAVGTPFTCTGTFTNTGVGNIALNPSSPVVLGNASFAVGLAAPSSTCPSESAGGLAPGKSCVITINGRATSAATWQTSVSANFKRVGTFTAATLSQNSGTTSATATTGAQTPNPLASLTDFTCTNASAQVGTPYTCTATLSSVGNTPLTFPFYGFSVNNNMGAISNTCGTTLAVGSTCTLTLQGALGVVGARTATVTVTSNAPVVTKQISFNGLPASLKLTTVSHPASQYGEATAATQTLTNQGNWPVSLSRPAALTGLGLGITGTTCGSTLAAGASCTITTSCTPATATSVGTLTVYPSVANSLPVSGTIGCSGTPASARLESATGQLTSNAGGFSSSGNWYRVVNTGSGKLTISGMSVTAPSVVFFNGNNADHCAPGKVVQPGGSCVFLATSNIGSGINTASVQVLSNAAPLSTTQRIEVNGVAVVASKAFPASTLKGLTETAEYTVTNNAKWPVSNLSAQLTSPGTSEAGKGYAVSGTTCPTVLPAGASCKVNLTFSAPSAPGAASSILNIKGEYPQVLNGVAYPSTGSGVQGSAPLSVGVTTPSFTLTAGTYTPVPLGQTATATSTLRNNNAVPVTFTGAPSLNLPYHTVVSTTCSGTLLPSQTCRVTTQFKPTAASQAGQAVLSIPTSAATVTGTLNGVLATLDLSIGLGAVPQVGPGDSGTFDVTFQNTSNTTTVTGVGQFAISAVAGTSNISLNSFTCVSLTAGASCDIGNKRVSIPGGGSIVMRVGFTAANGTGSYTISGSITNKTSGTDESNLANNAFTRSGNQIALVLTEKTCMFTNTSVKGRFLGCSTRDCENGGTVGAPYLGTAWIYPELFDGWVSVPGYTGTSSYLPTNKAVWKGTNIPVSYFSKGGYTYLALPQVQYWTGSAWVDDFRNVLNGVPVPNVLAYWSGYSSSPGQTYHQPGSAPGTVTPIGRGTSGVWRFWDASGREYLNYKASGVDYTGRQYRQVWIENSLGSKCQAPGTTRVQ